MWETISAFIQFCWPALLVTAMLSYLLGSANFAIIVTRAYAKADIRQVGSGNAGATNVLRSQGKLPAALTTVGDLAKSMIAVVLGGQMVGWLSPPTEQYSAFMFQLFGAYVAGLFVIIGHLYPLYFGFRGGKGVMSALGMMLMLDWKVALLCLSLFILVVLASRMVSLGSICAATALPILTCVCRLFWYHNAEVEVLFCTIVTTIIAVILVCKHIPNIKRILAGTESRLSFGKKDAK